ncbi:N-acetyltransferase [Aurantiacibacter xanthus]|uniref:N-acetyltransferase n=1 Tax=Aurantiacibacter xanthus TaxID=1784712 RepID=A0A3A1PEW6_9SPHN|nr:GNAT family N-acetyltransferase [Aurantiacibacter xanthus]RIV92293.1 N-acetyltransferase [Aurantiacibacter xanthus]
MSDQPAIILETERLRIHMWDDASWADFVRYTNTPAVMRWLNGVRDEAGTAQTRKRLEGFVEEFGHTFWCCRRKDDGGHLSGAVLGMVGFKRATTEGTKVHGMLEIGWRLREDVWGKGYAKEGASGCLDYIFAQRDEDDVVALTVAENTDSWGLMQRLGMQRREEWDYEDPTFPAELNPTIVHHITRAQWLAQR